MKKIFILLALSVLICSLYADLMVPTGKTPLNIESFKRTIKGHTSVSREAPDYEFVTDPVSLITNFYDYMPGSYCSTPVRVQPDDVGGGVYITFHAMENSASTRREYYAYIDSDGTLMNCATIGTDDLHEGYSGIDIDPVTGDPFVAWHVDVEPATPDLEVVGAYDLFHVLMTPGLWIPPFIIIDDTIPTPNGVDDEFIWPYVHIGPSPVAGKRRVYVVANNSYSPGTVSENLLICYADFNVDDLNAQLTLDWTYTTIPLMDQWNQNIPEWIRPHVSFDVSKTDGKVSIFGFHTSDSIFVFLNENYGEGDYEYISSNYQFDVWNPQNQDGSYYFEEGGVPYNLYWSFVHSDHLHSIFTDGTNKLNLCGNLGLLTYDSDVYWPFWIYPKTFQYDLDTQEFSFHDLYVTGANPDDNIPMVPWDLDEDGVVDSWDPEGYVEHVHGWPIYFWDSGTTAFHENTQKMTSKGNWLVNIWQDGKNSKYYNDWSYQQYIDWAEIAEVMISISNDGGATWWDPIIMNAKSDDVNFVTQFDGMHPCYFYPGDEIEDLGDNWGLVHLFFLDDYSYGSSIHGFGEPIGGMMHYASIKIDFELPWSSTDDNTIVPAVANLSQNYPNPFNPSTKIAYSLNEAGEVSIEVYNIKGQKVCTLINEYRDAGNYTVQWNGKDNSNQSVSSGVYFYKMRSSNYSSTKKMILMK